MQANLGNGKMWLGDTNDNSQPVYLSQVRASFGQGLTVDPRAPYLLVTNDLITGKVGGQTIVGGITKSDTLNFLSNTIGATSVVTIAYNWVGYATTNSSTQTNVMTLDNLGDLTINGSLSATNSSINSLNISLSGTTPNTFGGDISIFNTFNNASARGLRLTGSTSNTGGIRVIAPFNVLTFDLVMPPTPGLRFQSLYADGQGNTYWSYPSPPQQLNKIVNYNGVNTAGNGMAAILAVSDLVAQTAAISTTTLLTPTASTMYRISVYLQVTTAASVSSVLGGATGVVITYNDGDGNAAQTDTVGLTAPNGTLVTTLSTNTTATNLSGSIEIYARAGVPIQFAIGYTSAGTAMQYAAHLRIEQI